MQIRKTREDDIKSVMVIYDVAKKFMRANGNMNQWVNGYPSEEDVRADISKDSHYVVVDDEGEIVACFFFTVGIDKTYNYIEGEWLNDSTYGVIHRIASLAKVKGMLSYVVDYCLTEVKNIRIDTHEDNIPMQNACLKKGFTKCGIIYLENGDPRIAFHLCKEND